MEDALLRAFGALALVVLVLFVVLMALRRYTAQKFMQGDRSQFRLLGQLTIRPKQTIGLLLVGEKIVVVGMTEQSITPLTEITDPTAVQTFVEQSLIGLSGHHPQGNTSFLSALTGIAKGEFSSKST